jgi:Heterokaryon incompatibility protein (HET)
MAEIYEQSYLTVAATRAKNSQHGFLFDFPDDTIHYKIVAEAPWDTDNSELRTFNVTFQIDHKASKADSTPLDRRAWCLQEWYLPKRIVEFCLNDIRLMCLHRVETRFGRTNDEHTWTRTIVRAFGVAGEDTFRTLWENIRRDLFGRLLTKASDKLPAMAGLAKQLEKTLVGAADHKYLAGLWSERISEDLSWTVLDFDTATESIESVPTWSWASTTAPSDYIYGRPFETFVDLVEAHCTGYARPKEAPAFLKVKGFVKSLCLRVDPQYSDYGGRPNLSFWVDEKSAMAASTEEIVARRKASRTGSVFVSDMPICPASHDHLIMEGKNESCPRRVPSIIRASGRAEKCNICAEKVYVSPVELLLLTRTDAAVTVLILTPVLSQSLKGKEHSVEEADRLYQRLGLLEIDCIRSTPLVETADGYKIPAETFWEIRKPSTRRIIPII